jgi:site-specific DNA-adenine methylase
MHRYRTRTEYRYRIINEVQNLYRTGSYRIIQNRYRNLVQNIGGTECVQKLYRTEGGFSVLFAEKVQNMYRMQYRSQNTNRSNISVRVLLRYILGTEYISMYRIGTE